MQTQWGLWKLRSWFVILSRIASHNDLTRYIYVCFSFSFRAQNCKTVSAKVFLHPFEFPASSPHERANPPIAVYILSFLELNGPAYD